MHDVGSLARRMIVIAENEDGLRTVLAHALERRGYQVVTVPDGALVWPTIEAGGVDLVILDLRMPGMNGWEVLRRLKDAHHRELHSAPQLPVIVISAQNDPETQSFAVRMGAAAFLAKPIDLDDLNRTVRSVLRTTAGDSA
jgi:two-component system OmpR family response regulator